MKTNSVIGAAIWAAITAINTGCDMETDKSQFNQTMFPTNHWKVVGHGTNGEVVVETTSTNLVEYLRVHKATAVSTLTNNQPVRVEMVVRPVPMGRVLLISSKAYPASE